VGNGDRFPSAIPSLAASRSST